MPTPFTLCNYLIPFRRPTKNVSRLTQRPAGFLASSKDSRSVSASVLIFSVHPIVIMDSKLVFLLLMYVIVQVLGADEEPRFLALPDAAKCAKRPKEFFYDGHWYFFSGNVTKYRNAEVDWLEARNSCREYCMDTVSLESEEENNIIKDLVKDNNLKYIWTSGRLCDFKGCSDRADLQPVSVNGWFWSASGTKMAPTNSTPKGWGYQPWSYTGNNKKPQPDNAEVEINGTPESCLAVLNNVYGDGLHWHDVACYHPKAFVCEDSDELLKYARATNPKLAI